MRHIVVAPLCPRHDACCVDDGLGSDGEWTETLQIEGLFFHHYVLIRQEEYARERGSQQYKEALPM